MSHGWFYGEDEDDVVDRGCCASMKRLWSWKENAFLFCIAVPALIMASVALYRVHTLTLTAYHREHERRFCVQLRVTRTDGGGGGGARIERAVGAGKLGVDAARQIVYWDLALSGARNVTGLALFGPLALGVADGDMETAYALADMALMLTSPAGGALSDQRLLGAQMVGAPVGGAGDGEFDAVDTLTAILRDPALYFVSVMELQHPRIGVLNGVLGSEC
jgi:hypothetical protein